jgi:glycosyltransferase involved in cell wall biosynthesis
MKKLSVVICVYNEAFNIRPLATELIQVLDSCDFEVIFVDDGSSDATRQEILDIHDERFTLIELKKNYGQSSALQAGISAAESSYIVLMDGDLQNDPGDIPALLRQIESASLDMVAGIRKNRRDGFFLRRIPSNLANYIIRKSTGVKMKDLGCTLKIFSAEAIKSIHIYGELHRYIPVLLVLEGYTRLSQQEVNHRPRVSGVSKYNLSRTTRVLSDLLLMLFFRKYMQRPMHFFGSAGILTFGAGMLINFYFLILKISGQDIWGKPLLLLGILLVLGGIQFITIGILAELQMRTYFEGQGKTPFRIHKITKLRKDDLLGQQPLQGL